MEEENPGLDGLLNKSKKYIDTNIELYKLIALDKSTDVISSLIYRLIIFIVFTVFTVMFNIGIAYWLGEILGHVSYGFFIVAGFYLILALFIYLFKEQLVKRPISEILIGLILKNDTE